MKWLIAVTVREEEAIYIIKCHLLLRALRFGSLTTVGEHQISCGRTSCIQLSRRRQLLPRFPDKTIAIFNRHHSLHHIIFLSRSATMFGGGPYGGFGGYEGMSGSIGRGQGPGFSSSSRDMMNEVGAVGDQQ